jgi:hypothetical protein
MNVFKFGMAPWRRPANWWSNTKVFFRRFKWAHQRATRGFADCDVWNLDCSILEYLSGALNYLADHHWGFPGNEQFPTDESWTSFLKDMAQKFYQANESNEFYPTSAENEWWEYINHDSKNERKLIELKNAMLEEERENEYKRERDFAEAWSALGDVFWHLWD